MRNFYPGGEWMVITYDFKKVCSGSPSNQKNSGKSVNSSLGVFDLSKEREKLDEQKFRDRVRKEAERLTW